MINADDIKKTIDGVWESEPILSDEPSAYISASEIGKQCERYLWMKFHGLTFKEKYSALKLRSFSLDRREKHFSEAQLQLADFNVEEDCNNRSVFKLGFLNGGWDGIVSKDGLKYVVLYKAHSDASFKKLAQIGVRESNLSHYSHLCLSGKFADADALIYFAMNKNNGELHIEVLPRNDGHAQMMIDRSNGIAESFDIPLPCSMSDKVFPCIHCNAVDICRGRDRARIDCRNCANVNKDVVKGVFSCSLGRDLKPCKDHLFNPKAVSDLYGLEIEDINQETKTITFYTKSCSNVVYGGGGLDSDEFLREVTE